MAENFEIKGGAVYLYLNEEMYSKEVLFHAAYVLLEDYYFFFDKKNGYFEVKITPMENKEENELQEIANSFLNELVESSAYLRQLEKTSGVRELLLERALLTQQGEEVDFSTLSKDIEKDSNSNN